MSTYDMIVPVRCFSCGKPLAHLWDDFKRRVNAGEKPNDVMEDLGFERWCCKSVFLGQEDFVELVSKFKKS